MATPPRVQIRRTVISDLPPTGLLEGELAVELGTPTRLWVGVPVGIDPAGRKLIIDVSAPGTQFVDVTGDTMTGPLVLSGAPTIDLHASTKKYVDDLLTAAIGALAATYVDAAGDTMTGPLVLPIAAPIAPEQAANKKYVDDAVSAATTPSIPAGSVMLFYQAAAPVGWTKVMTQNDKALRVVSGAGGVAGGTNAFSTVNAQTVVGGATPTQATMVSHTHSRSDPTHAHTYTDSSGGSVQPGASFGGLLVGATATSYMPTGATIVANGSNGAHNHTINLAMQYIDVILASKD
jgi:hypothetical protein